MRKVMTGIVVIVMMSLVSCGSSSVAPDSELGQRNVSDGSSQGPSGIWYDGIDDLE